MLPPLIIGGGPAGAAAATVIAAAGHKVTLVERNPGPVDKLCGDFLAPGAITALAELGFDPATANAVPIRSLRLIDRQRTVEAALPFPALALSRRTLDEALLRLAMQRGAEVRRGKAVRRLPHSSAQGPIFIATGKHDLPGLARPPRSDGLLGLKMYFTLAPDQHAALADALELILLRGGYAGLQKVDAGRAVLCLLAPTAWLRRAGRGWNAWLDALRSESRWLDRRLTGARACLEKPLAIAGTPFGHLHHPARESEPNLYRLGDQACVIPSLVGEGVGIALQSGLMAATAWLDGADSATYHARLARVVRLPLRCAGVVHAACRSPALQPWVVRACRGWPDLTRLTALATRARGLFT